MFYTDIDLNVLTVLPKKQKDINNHLYEQKHLRISSMKILRIYFSCIPDIKQFKRIPILIRVLFLFLFIKNSVNS